MFSLMSQDKSNKALQKGDFVINCPHSIDLIAKLAILYKTAAKRELDVNIASKYVLFI